ncbi:MAG: hypothetical protein ACE14M_16600 [Terriglobales bacterium]
MRRFPALIGVLVVLSIGFTACSGGDKAGPPANVTVTDVAGKPFLSLTPGQQQFLVAVVTDANNRVIPNPPPITWSITSDPDPTTATVSTAGNVCAGTWNADFTICTPTGHITAGTPTVVTASIEGGISGSADVFVHVTIDSVTIAPAASETNPPPSDIANCISQGATAPANSYQFTAKAFSGTTDITSSVGPFTWTVTPATVATVSTVDNTTAKLTAQLPGQANVNASAGGTTGGPAVFVTCPVALITVSPDTFGPVNVGANTTLTAEVRDTKDNPLTNPVPPLTWSSSQPASISVTTGTDTSTATAVAGGNSSIVASCTPPSCNVNLPSGGGLNDGYPVYSNLVTGSVSSTSTPETILYVGSSTNAPGLSGGSTTLVSINTVSLQQTNITLPAIPNSMIMNLAGTKVYMGSDGSIGLMILDAATNTVTQVSVCGVSTCAGKLLAVSPDGNIALISNGTQVFPISGLNTTPTPQPPLAITNATRASFSPDSFKAFIVTSDGAVFAFDTAGLAFASVSLTSADAVDAAFLAQGSFAFLAGGGGANSIDVLNTCDNLENTANQLTTAATPLLIASVPNATQALAVDTTNVYVTNVSITGPSNCAPTLALTPSPPSVTTIDATSFVGSTFTPNQLLATTNNQLVYVSTAEGLFRYKVTAGTLESVLTTADNLQPTRGVFTLDGRVLYLAVAENAVIPFTQADNPAVSPVRGTSIPLNSSFVPDLIAVKPKK